jgi:hypothetical protein
MLAFLIFHVTGTGAGLAQSVLRLGYGLGNQGSIFGRGGNFSLYHRLQTGSGVLPALYPMGTGVFFPRA